MNYKDEYNLWLKSEYIDEKTKEELREILEDEKEIEDRFYKHLEFGTAGLRGIMGAGTNRMNIYTVRAATQGLANYLLSIDNLEKREVVIAYDCRINSKEFAECAALCLAANGIKTYMFDSLRPTPELSYAVRRLGCIAGINITASHNPKEYNGYKVYFEDGAQITYPVDKDIIEEVNKITDYSKCKTMDIIDAQKRGLYVVLDSSIDDSYIDELKKLIISKKEIEACAKDIKIVYTPLHGAGNILVRRILKEAGFDNVYVVKEQEEPDGNFPTASYPNPEQSDVFELALELARKENADIVLATDPDSDRLGVYIKDSENTYHRLNGNMIGCLLLEYTLRVKKEHNQITDNSFIIKTIVSSNMADVIAKNYNVEVKEVLTGFKYIGEKIKQAEKTGEVFEFGYEESFGYLIGTHARDKDAVVSAMKISEACAYYKDKGLTLWDVINDMYSRYGYYLDDSYSVTLEGVDGANNINKIMDYLRNHEIKNIGGFEVLKYKDYNMSTGMDYTDNKVIDLYLPKSNVLYFELEDNAWLCIRPSGTEPKIKFYIGVVGENIDSAYKSKLIIEESINQIVDKIC